jgi:uncharacterized protein (DUF302 family)
MTQPASYLNENGIATMVSTHSFADTLQKLQSIITSKGLKIFAVIDHSGEAAAVGLEMSATKVVIFGNAKSGTPIMKASPSAALDLPLKVLIAESDGKVRLSYNAPKYLAQRHSIPEALIGNIAGIEMIVRAAAE